MVAGFFGMNLVSGVENALGGFWIATLLSTFGSAALFFSCTRRFRNVSLQQRSRLKDVQALKRVLTNVDAVALLLRAKPATDLDRLLESSGVPKVCLGGPKMPKVPRVGVWCLGCLGCLGCQCAQAGLVGTV